MAVTSGFFNSVNGDRKYNAEQMSALISSIIKDGVFKNIGTAFSVKATTGNSITVGIGRAWFNDTWLDNDTVLPITLSDSELVLDRIDAVVIEINRSEDVRNGSIKVVKGTPASSPKRPTMIATQYVHQYPLAYITRKSGSSTVTQSNIAIAVGTSSCPYITAVLEVQNIDTIVMQWEAMWKKWLDGQESEFMEWYNSLSAVLQDGIATSLASRILTVENQMELLTGPGAAAHRKIFRGKNLGDAINPTQASAIIAGTFTDLYVGDYWLDANGTKWRIADFDYWYKFGDTPCNQHHVVVVPDKPVYTSVMNDTATTDGGYVGSKMYSSGVQFALGLAGIGLGVRSFLTHREYLITDTSNGLPSAGSWKDSIVDLMNEYMVYGAPVYGATNGGATVPKMYNNSGRQLALFALAPQYIIGDVEGTRTAYWLRDIVSATKFAQVTAQGPINEVNASVAAGVRPALGIVDVGWPDRFE